MIEYKKLKSELAAKRWAYPYLVDLINLQFQEQDSKVPVFSGQISLTNNNFTELYWMFKDGDWEKYLDYYSDKVSYLNERISVEIALCEHFDGKSLSEIPFYFKRVQTAMKISAALRGIDIALTKELLKFLTPSQISIAAAPAHQTMVAKEESALLTLRIDELASHLTQAQTKNQLQKIYQKYKWIYYGLFNERPPSFTSYRKKFQTIKNPKEILLKNERTTKNLQNQKRLLTKELTAEQKRLVTLASDIAYLKDYNKYFMTLSIGHLLPYWTMLSEKTKISLADIMLLLSSQIIDLSNGKKVNLKKAKQQSKHTVFIGLLDEYKVLSGKQADHFKSKYIVKESIHSLKGRCASPGIAQGKVKIILRFDDFKLFEKNDILVVSNTTPDYMPLIRKAAGILAEEGGLTAHVSVVSREFGIPCIVGLKDITKILKNNQTVRMDAQKEIIQIK